MVSLIAAELIEELNQNALLSGGRILVQVSWRRIRDVVSFLL
jgi:hypothetical protein